MCALHDVRYRSNIIIIIDSRSFFKEKNGTTSKQSRATQLERKSPTKDKQSPAIVKRSQRIPTKADDKNIQQASAHVASQTPKQSTNVRKKAQTRAVQRTSKLSELREKLLKKKPRTRKESNKKNKVDLNVGENSKFKSKPNSPSKSKSNAISSKELEGNMPKVCQSRKTRGTTKPSGSSLKRKMEIKSPVEGDTEGNARSRKTPKTKSRKTSFKKMTVPRTKTSSNQEHFSKMFLKKLEIIAHIDKDKRGSIHAISVTNDNLVWVNYLQSHVKLFDASGNVLRSVSLEQPPVFNCCTSTGDLLFTQGYAGGARAEVIMVPREGNPRILADLSSYARNLCGIVCQEEKIYVVCWSLSSGKYFVIKLDMNGEVEETYETMPQTNINHIVSHHGTLYAIGTNDFSLLPLEDDKVFIRDITKVGSSNVYSASTSIDNHDNVIMGSESQIHVSDPSLQCLHKMRTDISGSILSTAVDHLNQLWIGTRDGHLYISKYLK